MKKLIINFLFWLLPLLSFGQWQQMGNALNGIADGDDLGSVHTIDIDSNGTTIAVGSPINSQFGSFTGYAQVLDWDGTQWIVRGDAFWGSPITQGTGSAVSLSADGLTLALGISHGENSSGIKSGIVKVFDWNGSAWVLRGATIDGEGSGDVFGTALQLSSDGNKLIVGGRSNSPDPGVNLATGHTRVYHWNGSAWVQIGQDIDGQVVGGAQQFGYSVSIDDAGNRIAIGARSFNGNAQSSGAVFMFEFNVTDWQQLGTSLIGNDVGEYLGTAVHITKDGNTVAVGAPATSTTGQVVVFDWNGLNWFMRGTPIVGNGSLTKTGQSIDLSDDGNRIVIGQPSANSFNGRARMFEWNGSSWQQIGSEFSPSLSNSIDAFGSAVRMNATGSRVVIGAPGTDAGGFDLGEVTVYTDQSDAGIDGAHLLNIQVYPNPSKELIHISSDVIIEMVTLFDMSGREIISVNSSSMDLDIAITSFENGQYVMAIQTENGLNYSSILKQD